MKLLSIDFEHNGLFLKNGEWASIDSLQKEDIVCLIRTAAANHIEVDELTEERYIKRPASKTIYEKLSEVLLELEQNRDMYLSEIDREFNELEREYGLRITSPTEAETEEKEA